MTMQLQQLQKSLANTADPPLAEQALRRLVQASEQAAGENSARLREELATSSPFRERLLAVLGASVALGDHLVQRAALGAADWEVLGAEQPQTPPLGLVLPTTSAAQLRCAYRRELLRIAAADLTGQLPIMSVAAQLSDLADATVNAAMQMAAEPNTELAVLALGKCGARELNYVSDVDVLFLTERTELAARATACARRVMQICHEVAWRIDPGLRPEGQQGPLVRTLDSYVAYYQRWADSWEFQALLKARWVVGPPAGSPVAQGWSEQITPLVWRAASRPNFVADAQAMRRRVEQRVNSHIGHIGVAAYYDIKLGPGGLRDIEFAVQLLQLVHGQGDPALRSADTVSALSALTDGGYIGRDDGAALHDSYCFLRIVEHRLQLRSLRRTHQLVADPVQLRWLARSLGYHRLTGGQRPGDAVELFLTDWRRHSAQVRQLHEKLFYRPLLTAVVRLPSDSVRLTPDAARHRLASLGFADPPGALAHVAALSTGVSRRAAIQRALLPVILAELAQAADPDAGLLAYRRVSEQLGRSPWFLRLMRDGGVLALRLAKVLGHSKYIANLLERDVHGLNLLASDDDLVPRSRTQLVELLTIATRRMLSEPSLAPTPESGAVLGRAIAALRSRRRHELLRIACADVCGLLPFTNVGPALSDLTDAVLGVALEAALAQMAAQHAGVLPMRLAVIAMGRYGGQESSYASDADVLFVYEPQPGVDAGVASAAAQGVARQLIQLLAQPGPDPGLVIDTDLRPEGRGGSLAASLGAYERYYQTRSQLWESQALLRARWVAGDAAVGAAFIELIDPLRYPKAGLNNDQLRELKRMKARVETERLPRGGDPSSHLKLGRGALVDVEWTVQLMQLRHVYTTPALRTPRTLQALHAERGAGLIDEADCAALERAWLMVSRLRDAVTLVRGSAADQLPRTGRELSGVVRLASDGASDEVGVFTDTYLRTTRQARKAVDRLLAG